MRISLVVNPIAGNRAHRCLDETISILKKEASVDVLMTRTRGDAYSFAWRCRDSDRIIVLSGDGTINEVVNGMIDASLDIPIGIVPAGVTNVLAKELDLPEDIPSAAVRAMKGKPHRTALGRINGRFFILMAGAGFDADVVRDVERGGLKKISGKGAHIVGAMRKVINYNPPAIKVMSQGIEMIGYTVVVSNARCYGGRFHVNPDASMSGAHLEVCVLKEKGRMALARLAAAVIAGRKVENSSVNYFRAREIKLSSEEQCHVQIDGDYFGTLPADIGVVPDKVSFIC